MSVSWKVEGAMSGCLSVRIYESPELFARVGGVKVLHKEKTSHNFTSMIDLWSVGSKCKYV